MQCPLRHPLQNGSPQTTMCPDGKCSDNCATNFRMYPFGAQFDQCQRPEVPVPTVSRDVWDEFKITKVLTDDEKDSASKSVIALGHHVQSEYPVAMKCFFVTKNQPNLYNEELVYEVKVYEAIRQLAKVVPHIVSSIAVYDYDVDDLKDNASYKAALKKDPLLVTLQQELMATIILPPGRTLPPLKLYFSVTSLAPGVSLLNYIRSPSFNTNKAYHIQSIIFQLLFSMHAMFMMGFQHNDMHLGNIMIDSQPNCTHATYEVQGVRFSVPTPVKVYIYDFDRASCSLCGEPQNPILKRNCPELGMCNERNPHFDMYTALMMLYDQLIRNHTMIDKYGEMRTRPAPWIEVGFQISNLYATGAPPQIPSYISQELFVLMFELDRIDRHRNEDLFEMSSFRLCNYNKARKTCGAFPFKEPFVLPTPAELLLTYFHSYIIL